MLQYKIKNLQPQCSYYLLIVLVLRSPKYSSMIIERIGNRQIEGCCYEVITPLATIATTEKYKILNDVLLLKEYSA